MMIKDFKNVMWLSRFSWRYGRAYTILWIMVRVLRFVVEDLMYVLPPMIIMNLLVEGRTFRYIAGVAIAIGAASLCKSILPRLFSRYFARKKEEIEQRLKQDVYGKAVGTDYRYIDDPGYYDDYAWAVNGYADQVSGAVSFLASSGRCLAGIAVMVSIIATVEVWMLPIEAAQLVLHALVGRRMNRCDMGEREELVPIDRRLGYCHRLFYMKDYASDLKATLLKTLVLDGFHKAGGKKVRVRSRYEGRKAFWRMADELVFAATTGIIMLLLVHGIQSGSIPGIGMYVTMLLAFYQLDYQLRELTDLLEQANSLSLNAQRIRRFFDIEPGIEAGGHGEGAEPPEGRLSVELRDVGFGYGESGFALSHVNLSIRAGEKVAVVGENGAGKSTLVKLLLRLYDVQEGEILIGGRPIGEYDPHRLRQRIGVAFQDTNIYAMSLRENVSLYGQVPEGRLEETSEKLGLRAVLEKNRGGYDTELTREFDEGGMVLSGGEAQKVALARVMCGEFVLLLLDEPSSALDPIAEHRMNETILDAAGGATAIIVSHRLSTVRNADRIVLMDGGSIRELGTHDELMALKGKYYEMFTLQAKNYAD